MENISLTVFPVGEVFLVTALLDNRLVLLEGFLLPQLRLFAFFAPKHFLGRCLHLHLVRVNDFRFFFEVERLLVALHASLLQLVS